jgi:hypothetical protein
MGTGTHVLADNGSTSWKIITGADAAPAERHAAQELQRFLKEISGAWLPVLDDRAAACPCEIIIGVNGRLEQLGVQPDWQRLGDDGFLIQTIGDNLVIAGGSPRGTLYGVYTFLEEQLGCRWFTPSVSRIPTNSRVAIPDMQQEQIPQLIYREPYFFDARDPDWSVRNKVNGNSQALTDMHGGKVKYTHFVHTFNELVSTDEYFDTHPEYFSLIDGKRLRKNTQLCLTNPEVLELVLQKVRLWLEQDPDANIVSVSQNDCYNPCQCERCRSIDDYEGSHSGTLIRFVNQVAKAVVEDYPNVCIDTLAYQYTRKAPKHTKPERNVIVRLCTIECCFSHPLEACREISWPFGQLADPETAFAQDLFEWSQICGRLTIWDYVTNFAHYLMPFPNLRVLGPNIRFLAEHQVKGIFEQGNYQSAGGDFAELKAYMLAKLLWNPACDANKVMEEFLEGFYGHAAAPMREYIDLLQAKVQDENIHVGIYDSPAKGYLTEDVLNNAEVLFDRAEALADDVRTLQRVKTARFTIEYARFYSAAKDQGDWAKQAEAFLDRLSLAGITAVSEYLTVDECRRLTRLGLSPREIEALRSAQLGNG